MQKFEYISLIKQKFVKIHDFRASLRNRAVVKSKSSELAKLVENYVRQAPNNITHRTQPELPYV